MADETVWELLQEDVDVQIHEAECRLELLRAELQQTFEGNIKIEYRCKTCALLWHEHRNKQVAGCGGTGVLSEILL
jgi:transcriptional regulator